MQWIIDHIAAFVVACTILLILFVLQLRGQDASIEATQYNTAKVSLHTVTGIIEQDLANIGAGMLLPEDPALGARIELDTTNRRFTFWTRPNRADPNPQRVEYRWDENGEITLGSGDNVRTVPTYQITRGTGNPPANFVPVSSNTITEFNIILRDATLAPVDLNGGPLALAATRRIDVLLKIVSPLERGEFVGAPSRKPEATEETRWERQIRPVNLQRPGRTLLLQGGS